LIDRIGIDIDTKDLGEIAGIMERAERHGLVTEYYETKKGYHMWVKLNRKVSRMESFKLRHRIGDDPNRILFDVFRWHDKKDAKLIDVLFDSKRIIKIGDKLKP